MVIGCHYFANGRWHPSCGTIPEWSLFREGCSPVSACTPGYSSGDFWRPRRCYPRYHHGMLLAVTPIPLCVGCVDCEEIADGLYSIDLGVMCDLEYGDTWKCADEDERCLRCALAFVDPLGQN